VFAKRASIGRLTQFFI